jgi:hypothetical protein
MITDSSKRTSVLDKFKNGPQEDALQMPANASSILANLVKRWKSLHWSLLQIVGRSWVEDQPVVSTDRRLKFLFELKYRIQAYLGTYVIIKPIRKELNVFILSDFKNCPQ